MRIIVLTIALTILLVSWRISAQTTVPEPEFTPIYAVASESNTELVVPENLHWSQDSSTFYFRTLGGETYAYDIMHNTLNSQDMFPFVFELNTEEQSHFHASSQWAYLAPNQRNFVYRSTLSSYRLGEGGYYAQLLAIGDIESRSFEVTRQSFGSTFRWSDDMSSLVIEWTTPYGSQRGIAYVRDTYSTQYPSRMCYFCYFHEGIIGFMDTGRSIFDISPDGKRILYQSYSILRLWDVDVHADFAEQLREGDPLTTNLVIGAAFAEPDDMRTVFAVTVAGIVRFDLHNNATAVVNPEINTEWAGWVSFSPDNQWVAVLAGGHLAHHQVYVLPVIPE